MAAPAIDVRSLFHGFALRAAILFRLGGAGARWVLALLCSLCSHIFSPCEFAGVDLGSDASADKVRDERNHRQNQKQMNQSRSHMKYQEASDPKDQQDGEQNNKYWRLSHGLCLPLPESSARRALAVVCLHGRMLFPLLAVANIWNT
jgi:hypothetical protein